MKFRTEITVPKADFGIRHGDRGLLIGSCFAEHLADKLIRSDFEIEANPFGVVYNPSSVAQSLRELLEKKVYTPADLFSESGIYHSFSHHSRFSGRDQTAVLEKINTTIERASLTLQQASYLIITFGSSTIYRLRSTHQPVSNCHKQPAALFDRQQLTLPAIATLWNSLLADLHRHNPNLRIILTVSPVRHTPADLHADRLSKSLLLLAVDDLVRSHPQCTYFPAYELLEDDLRDYRFYAPDLLHPNVLAIDYIWEKFSAAYFDSATQALAREATRRRQLLEHRPIVSGNQ